MTDHPLEQPVDAAASGELFEDQPHHRLDLLVRIDHEIAGDGPHVTDRRVVEDRTACGLVPHALLKATLEDM